MKVESVRYRRNHHQHPGRCQISYRCHAWFLRFYLSQNCQQCVLFCPGISLNPMLWVVHQTRVCTLSSWVFPYLAGYVFPVLFSMPAFASRVFLFPLRNCIFSCDRTYRITTDIIGVSTFHSVEVRLGWVPSLLRGLGCLYTLSTVSFPLYPKVTVSVPFFSDSFVTQPQRRFISFTRPVFSVPESSIELGFFLGVLLLQQTLSLPMTLLRIRDRSKH